MIQIILFLILSAFAVAAEPNQVDIKKAFGILCEHWLDVKFVDTKVFDPNVPDKHVFTIWPCDGNRDNYIVIRPKDPNGSLDVTSFYKRRANLQDFLIVSRQWPGDPNYQAAPSGYYSCKKWTETYYHILKCRSIRSSPLFGVGLVWFMEIPTKDMNKYTPCPVCLPELQSPAEPNLAEMLEGVTDPDLRKAIEAMW